MRAAVRAAVAGLLLLTSTQPTSAICDLKPKASQVAIKVLDGETVQLDDGRLLRLAGVMAPRPPRTAGADARWPSADAARTALAGLVLGKRLDLAFPGRKADRYGRVLAQAFLAGASDRIWVQAELVGQGHARVQSSPDLRTCIAELLVLEDQARRAKLGLWSEPAYAVKEAGKPDELLRHPLEFALVEGRVLRISAAKSSIYIEFDRRWREDFTVLIRGRERALFAKAGIDLALLAGRRIRVRGWIESYNGPMMRVTHPEQIELIDGKAAE